MSRMLCALLCVAAVAQPLAVFAATPEPGGPGLATSPAAAACAARYLDALHYERTTKAMMASISAPMLEMFKVPGQRQPPSELQTAITEAANDALTELTPKLLADIKPIMTATYTEEEICALADFYASPVGQSVLEKLPAYMGEIMSATAKHMPEIRDHMVQRVCAKVSCKGTTLERTKMS